MEKKKILIIEDETFVRELYEREFGRAGYEISSATDGQEALAKVVEENWDLILLDIMLPKISGLDVLKEIKKKDSTKKIPVLLLTNLANEAVIKEGFSLGANGYLIKADYTPQQIIEEIKKFFKEQRL